MVRAEACGSAVRGSEDRVLQPAAASRIAVRIVIAMSRLGPLGWVAVIIIVLLIGVALLYVYRAFAA